jgi:hypothetical protein
VALRAIKTAVLMAGLLAALAVPAQAADGTWNRAIGFDVNPTGSNLHGGGGLRRWQQRRAWR